MILLIIVCLILKQKLRLKEVNYFSSNFYMVYYVISLIGITNIINTINTNMNLRRRELAMLKSIGND